MMLNSLEYAQLAAIKRGKGTMGPLIDQLAVWAKTSFNLPLVGFTCEQREQPVPATILRMFVERVADIDELCREGQTRHRDFRFKQEILDKFVELVGKNLQSSDFCLDNIIFTLWSFETEAREVCQAHAISETEALFNAHYAHLPIHQLSFHFGLHVFYEWEDDVLRYQKDGTNSSIKQSYYQILKRYDEFGVCTLDNVNVIFDSHENVVKNYQGNYYYYFK